MDIDCFLAVVLLIDDEINFLCVVNFIHKTIYRIGK